MRFLAADARLALVDVVLDVVHGGEQSAGHSLEEKPASRHRTACASRNETCCLRGYRTLSERSEARVAQRLDASRFAMQALRNMTPSTLDAQPIAVNALGALGRRVLGLAGEVGDATLFLLRALSHLVHPPFRRELTMEQVHFIGSRSVSIVVLTGAFTGLVLALQGYNALARFGAAQMVGALVSLSLIRELAPVLAALMVTARAGSAIAATLGNMRVTEQIDALKTMGVDPVSYLVMPRVLASVFVAPMLTALFTLTGLAVSQALCVHVLGQDRAQFASSVHNAIEWSDVKEGLAKSLIFAVLMAWIACYRGYHARDGAQGVGQATTHAVVETSVLVLAVDYILTALFF
jgi:phospholipid/cholesterol/gamma-HCH transport system permease protein